MTKVLSIVCLIILFGSCDLKSDEEQIKEVYENYKNAILDDDAELAVSFIDNNTEEYFNDILFHVINSDSIEISNLPTYDKMTIMIVRHTIEDEIILDLDGKTLFQTLISDEFIDRQSILYTGIGEVTVSGNDAFGNLLVNDEESIFGYDFHRINDVWKIDVSSIFEPTDIVLRDIVNEQNLTDIEYIFQSIEIKSGSYPDSTIWIPVGKNGL